MIIIVPTAEAYQFPLWYSESAAICVAGVLGLEPRLTEPESVGLPITLYPNSPLAGWGRTRPDARTNFTVSRVSAPNRFSDRWRSPRSPLRCAGRGFAT